MLTSLSVSLLSRFRTDSKGFESSLANADCPRVLNANLLYFYLLCSVLHLLQCYLLERNKTVLPWWREENIGTCPSASPSHHLSTTMAMANSPTVHISRSLSSWKTELELLILLEAVDTCGRGIRRCHLNLNFVHMQLCNTDHHYWNRITTCTRFVSERASSWGVRY